MGGLGPPRSALSLELGSWGREVPGRVQQQEGSDLNPHLSA